MAAAAGDDTVADAANAAEDGLQLCIMYCGSSVVVAVDAAAAAAGGVVSTIPLPPEWYEFGFTLQTRLYLAVAN